MGGARFPSTDVAPSTGLGNERIHGRGGIAGLPFRESHYGGNRSRDAIR